MANWLEQEPSAWSYRFEIARLWHRASRRPVLVLMIGLLVTVGAVANMARKRPKYFASVTFRINQIVTRGRLHAYVLDGVLTKTRCVELVGRFNLYPRDRLVDDERAAEHLRSDLEIVVQQNYLLRDDTGRTDLPRTAKIRIQYSYYDVDVALSVVRAMGEMVKQHESEFREARFASAAWIANQHADRNRRIVRRLRSQLARNGVALSLVSGERGASLEVERQRLRSQIRNYEAQLERHRIAATDLTLRADLDRRTVRFEPVDWVREPPPRVPRGVRLGLIGIFLVFVFLPATALIVAAFDSRLYNADDVRYLGIRPLATMPIEIGSRTRSLRERLEDRSGQSQGDRLA